MEKLSLVDIANGFVTNEHRSSQFGQAHIFSVSSVWQLCIQYIQDAYIMHKIELNYSVLFWLEIGP